MDYEKKYKEALEVAKRKLCFDKAGMADSFTPNDIYEMFPELQENEDERIRKELIFYLGDMPEDTELRNGVTNRDVLVWLEKQGEQKQDPCDNCKDVMLNCHNFPCIKKRAFKQGKSALEAINEEKVDNANKVNPKFHEGEWLCENEPNNYARFIQILEIVNVQGKERYRISRDIHNDEDIVEFDFVEKYYHKFDIKDAKDGDVLAVNDMIFIYKTVLSSHVVSYCRLIGNAFDYFEYGRTCCEGNPYIYPATKEQRDKLEKAMADAGYTFDFEKKELKKIDNETEIPYGAKDSELQEATYYIPKGFHAEIDEDKVVIKKGEKPTEWSEEDKVILGEIIYFFEKGIPKVQHDFRIYAFWLKSLKDRYTWKPSDEQMEELNYVVNLMGASKFPCENDYCYNVLKSLRDQLKKLK